MYRIVTNSEFIEHLNTLIYKWLKHFPFFTEFAHRFQCDSGCRTESCSQSRASQDVSDAMEPWGYTCKRNSSTNRTRLGCCARTYGCSDIWVVWHGAKTWRVISLESVYGTLQTNSSISLFYPIFFLFWDNHQ